jgi:hypothetical protein
VEIVALRNPQYGVPFLALMFLVKGEGEHPFDVVTVCC